MTTENEKLICEEIYKMFLEGYEVVDTEPDVKTAQLKRQELEAEFAGSLSDDEHVETIRSAFNKIHSQVGIDSTDFERRLTNELSARIVPKAKIKKAVDKLKKLKTKLDSSVGDEKSLGFNERLPEIAKKTRS